MLISSCDFKICFFHAPIIALNKFGSRSNTRAWWRPYWFWSFSCFLQDFNYSASCTLGKKFGGTVCKPAPLQPWFRCMPPVHLDHQSQALHLICLAPPIQAPSTGRFLGAQQASRLGSAPCRSLSRVLPPPPPQGSKDHMDGWHGNPFTGFGNLMERWCCHVVQPSQYCIYWIPFAAVLEIFRCIVCSYKIVHFHTNYSSYHIVQFWMC